MPCGTLAEVDELRAEYHSCFWFPFCVLLNSQCWFWLEDCQRLVFTCNDVIENDVMKVMNFLNLSKLVLSSKNN